MLSVEMHTSSRNLSKAVPSLEVGKVWPWGKAMSHVLSPKSQLLRLGKLLTKPRVVVHNKEFFYGSYVFKCFWC